MESTGLRSDVAISRDGVSIRYDVQGGGETTLIFVHGWCCDRHQWRQQVDHFSAHYRVVCLDLAGHGDSGQDRQQFTIPAFAQDVVAVVERLGADRAVLIGHSMSGGVIVEAARHLGTDVIGLVGADCLWDVDQGRSPEEVTAFMAPFHADFRKAARGFVRTMFTPTFDPTRAEAIMSAVAAAPSVVGTEALEASLGNSQNLREGLDEIKVPIALINSPHWRPTNMETARRRGFHVAVLPDVGHFVMFDDPEAFNRLLDDAAQRFGARGG
jgi:pimeloyl-ACP methyl ester carboxylesterase